MYLIAALLVLLAGTSGGMGAFQGLAELYAPGDPFQDVRGQFASVFPDRALGPIHIALPALLIVFLERIWLEMKTRKQNS